MVEVGEVGEVVEVALPLKENIGELVRQSMDELTVQLYNSHRV